MGSGRSELVDIDDVTFVTDTPHAVLVKTANDRQVWIPKSQCEWDGKVLTCERWLAEDKGLV